MARVLPSALRSIAVTVLLLAAIQRASALETPAKQAVLLDYDTGVVLFAKNADERMPPASMSKLMTIYMVFERLTDGRLKPGDTFTVSKKAWQMGGSKMFVEVGKEVTIAELLRGVIVQSGNDACIVLAEGIGGTEEAFAEEMGKRAGEIGLTQSSFRNASGWPDPDHMMSAHDLATLAALLIRKFPDQYPIFKEKEFSYAGIRQGNRNPLLYKNIGADGLKTGHTEASGYGLVASAVRDGRRLVLVVNGLGSVNERSKESARLLRYGFRDFSNYALLKAGEKLDDALVWLGDKATVPLIIEEPLTITLNKKARAQMTVAVAYDGPVSAPIAKGQRVGLVRIEAPGLATIERPLVAGEAVGRLGFVGRIGAAMQYLLFGASKP